MSNLHAVILGILQGLGEFLPISSSGHLVVAPWLFGWPTHSLSFDVALHLGTLVAVLAAFAEDWRRLLVGGFKGLLAGAPFSQPEGRLLGLLALASVPAAVAGVLLEDWAETSFRSPALVATTMAVMGGILLLADRRANGATGILEGISLRDALLIGLAQCLALVPGVSRSGATISMALFLSYKREESARFSFLLATPVTFGAAIFKVPQLLSNGHLTPVLLGVGAAAIFGLLSIRLLLAWVRVRDYRPFVYYRWVFAALVLGVLLVRSAGLS